MVQYIYLAVRLIVIAWALYRLWRWLHCGPVMKLWDRIPVRAPKAEEAPAMPRGVKEPVVGATNVVILDNPRAEPVPVSHSVDLKETGYLGKEEDVSPEDVETDYKPAPAKQIPTPDELYDDENGSYGPDPELSSGMSFEQIGDAVTVLVADERDEQRRSQAARTLYDLQNTPLYDFITREVSSTIALDGLIKEYIDDQGGIIVRKAESPADVRIRDFDIDAYV